MSAQGPHQIAAKACRWVARNPEAWERLLGLCRWFDRTRPGGAARLRRGDLYNYAQREGLSVTLCREFRFDNNIWSALSRYAIMADPALASVIAPRACELDAIDMGEVWQAHMGTWPFAVADWRQARGAAA